MADARTGAAMTCHHCYLNNAANSMAQTLNATLREDNARLRGLLKEATELLDSHGTLCVGGAFNRKCNAMVVKIRASRLPQEPVIVTDNDAAQIERLSNPTKER